MQKKRINRVGILLAGLSFLLTFVLLEIGLRLAGVLFTTTRQNIFTSNLQLTSSLEKYNSERDYEVFQKEQYDNSARVIWAIGDSYTNAGNVRSKQSYPAFLFQILQKNKYNYSVVNLGQCEDTTWGVYKRLKHLLRTTKQLPQIVIILVGSADPFYYLFSEEYLRYRGNQNLVNFIPQRKSWYEKLRLYKLYRYVRLSLINRQLSKGADTLTKTQVKKLHNIYHEIKTNYVQGKFADLASWKKYEKIMYKFMRQHKELVDGSETDEFVFNDPVRLVFNTITVPLMRYYSGHLDYTKALEILIKFVSDFPDFFWDDRRCDPSALYIMNQTMRFQSKYSGVDLLNIFKQSIAKVPKLKDKKFYKLALKLFGSKIHSEHVVEKVRLKAWEKIVQLAQQYKFRLVLQNYATDFTLANRNIEMIAKKHNLLLIDNYKYFKQYASSQEKYKIYADDNHFVPRGYSLMATYIYSELQRANMLHRN